MSIKDADLEFVRDKLAHDIDCPIWCVDGGDAPSHSCECGVCEAEHILDAIGFELDELRHQLIVARRRIAELLEGGVEPCLTTSR